MIARSFAAAVATAGALTVCGCASSAGSSEDTAPQSSTVGAVTPGASTSHPATSASASPPIEPAGATGGCTLLDQAAATQALGGDPGPGKASGGLGEDDGITKVDGCTYVGAGSHLGYDVLVIKGVPAGSMLTMAKNKLKAQSGSGAAKEFTTGLPQSVGYTFHVGTGVDSQIALIAGDHWVTVAVSRKDGDGTKTEAGVIAAAQALASAL